MAEVFAEEQPRSLPPPLHPFTTDRIETVRSHKTIYIRFDLNDYSNDLYLVRLIHNPTGLRPGCALSADPAIGVSGRMTQGRVPGVLRPSQAPAQKPLTWVQWAQEFLHNEIRI